MVSGSLFQAFDLVAKGVSPLAFGKLMVLIIPEMLRYTIPLSLLCGTVLLFSRLSADSEITAMKASGISLWQTITPALLFAALLSGVCFWLSASIAPRCRYEADQLKRAEVGRNPLALLEPGRFITEIPNYNIRVGAREGDVLGGIHILVLDPKTKELRRSITARRGRVVTDEKTRSLRLELEDATIANLSPVKDGEDEAQSIERVAMHTIEFPIEYGAKLDARPVTQKTKYLSMAAILARIHMDAEEGKPVGRYYVALHKRMSMALSPISFLLIGIPLAIRSRRSETSIGLLLSLMLGFGFYVFLPLADSVKFQAGLHPEFLVWLPNVLYQGGGLWALSRIEQH
jgi:lipopolysaccharide export LptBFGC system permease protein LptF